MDVEVVVVVLDVEDDSVNKEFVMVDVMLLDDVGVAAVELENAVDVSGDEVSVALAEVLSGVDCVFFSVVAPSAPSCWIVTGRFASSVGMSTSSLSYLNL